MYFWENSLYSWPNLISLILAFPSSDCLIHFYLTHFKLLYYLYEMSWRVFKETCQHITNKCEMKMHRQHNRKKWLWKSYVQKRKEKKKNTSYMNWESLLSILGLLSLRTSGLSDMSGSSEGICVTSQNSYSFP